MQAFAVCFGVFKLVQGSATLKSCLENLEGTVQWVESISADCRYIGEKVCYIECSISNGLSVSFCS